MRRERYRGRVPEWPPTGSTRPVRPTGLAGTDRNKVAASARHPARNQGLSRRVWDHVNIYRSDAVYVFHTEEPDHGLAGATTGGWTSPMRFTAMLATIRLLASTENRCHCAPNLKMAMWSRWLRHPCRRPTRLGLGSCVPDVPDPRDPATILKTLAHAESQELGEKLLLRPFGPRLEKLPEEDEKHRVIWDKLLRFTGNRNRAELLHPTGAGKAHRQHWCKTVDDPSGGDRGERTPC